MSWTIPSATATPPGPAGVEARRRAGTYIAAPRADKMASASVAPLSVVPGAALLGLHLEEHALDRHHPHGVAAFDGRRAVRARPPQRVAHAHHAVGVDADLGGPQLAHEVLTPDRRRREAR